MRITNSMMSDQFLRDANASLNRLSDAQNVVDSTKKISGIADDPLSTISSLKARNKLSNLADYQSAITAAGSYLKENENAAESLNQVVQSAYELMTSANGAKTDDDQSKIADEVASLRDEVLSIANSTLGTNYLFSGTSSERPFSVDQSTEQAHLIYNGLDLTKYSLNSEYQDSAATVADAVTQTGTSITSLSTSSDYYAKNTVCPTIISQLNTMITTINTAIQSAKNFGNVDTSKIEALEAIVSAPSGTSLTSIKESLESETSKDLYTADGQTNTFSTAACETALSDFGTLTAALSTALSDVGSDMDVTSIQDGLDTEAANVKELRIGSTQTIQISSNGLELLGTGTSNIYYILDKCVNILNGSLDKSLLSDMPAALQSAQSDLLSLDTKVGTLQNRLSMISDRYTASKSTYKEMQSDAEDADMAEAIVNLTSAKTVYDAALAAGSKIVQTSLVDFLT